MAVIKNNKIILNQETFSHVDSMARIHAGQPIMVYEENDKDPFAYVSCWALGVFDTRKTPAVVQKEMALIQLANQICLKKWKKIERPEIDWAAVPTEKIYDFLICHEISHVVNGHSMMYFDLQLSGEYFADRTEKSQRFKVNQKFRYLKTAAEMVADREAWEMMFPGKPLPLKSDLNDIHEKCNSMMEFLEGCKKRKITPITTDPRQYVPYEHEKNGIPWAH